MPTTRLAAITLALGRRPDPNRHSGAGGRRRGERRTGRITGQAPPESPQAPSRGPAPAKPYALPAEIGWPVPGQAESRNYGGRKGTLDILGRDRLYDDRGDVSLPISTLIGTFPV